MQEEIWKDVDGYEELYQVSNLGRVKSLYKKIGFYYRNEKILSNCTQPNGYLAVNLGKNSIITRKSVHRLVAQAFIPNLENKPFINHKDGNKKNNCVDNLEWVTHSENVSHAYKIGLNNHKPPVKIGKDNHTSKSVLQFDSNMNFIKHWECIMSATKNLGIDNSSITKCCRNRLKTAGGFIWRYANENN